MPPKQIAIRPDNALTKAELDAKAMPPPPVPAPQMSILEPEMNALLGCLKNAAVKSGQVFQFYHDSQKLQLRKYLSAPPRSLQASLGHELEVYDQICESIESQLLRAISVLQRDLKKEQQRIKEAEAAALASQAPAEPSSSQPGPLAGLEETMSETQTIETSSNPPQSPSVPIGRRGSTISISSLQRPAPPPKLDLSSVSLRLTGEEAFLSSGLHSPITLAPRSARPNTDYTDLMAAFGPSTNDNSVDIDLTLPDSDTTMDLNQSLGSSADKPIELDMDNMDMAMDLFGDSQDNNSNDNVDALFSPVEEPREGPGNMNKAEASFLSSLGVPTENLGVPTGNNDHTDDLFSSLQASTSQAAERTGDTLQLPPDTTEAAPSPGTLMASFAVEPEPTQSTDNAGGDQAFDLALFTQNPLGNFWNMDNTETTK